MIEQEQTAELENIPFEEQAKYGAVNSFFLTISMLVLSPASFYRKMHINKGYKLPLIFLILMLSIGNILSYIYIAYGIIDSPGEQIVKAMENEPELSSQAETLRQMLSGEPGPADIIFGIISNLFFIYIMILYWQLILKSLKIALNGFQATFRVLCYSSVILASSVIPFSSAYLNMAVYVWWIYIVYAGITEAHEVSGRLALRGIMISLFASLIPLIFISLAIF
jgi:hypothetical protein